MSKIPNPKESKPREMDRFYGDERDWFLRRGISRLVVTSGITENILKEHPQLASDIREKLEQIYPKLEFESALLAIKHLYFCVPKESEKSTIELSDICSSYFVDLVRGLFICSSFDYSKLPLNELDYLKFLGDEVVKRLENMGYIQIDSRGEGNRREPRAYSLTGKGRELATILIEQDSKTMGNFKREWSSR
ncbi:hypothetical protein HYX17_02660 [Candidatus Woesearchaeota archaeon]|nr:hypothetical protein [Candidatus Woesearchaeota archaeon]